MNKHQIKGAAKEMVGKVQKVTGIATANGTAAFKGAKMEIAGKAQKAYGNAKSNVKSSAKREMTSAKREMKREEHRDRDIERHAH